MTVRHGGLVHRYHHLGPEERFRATLEAAARGDEDEYDRLWDTCPTRHYSMTDGRFIDRWRAASTLATAVAVELGPRLANLRMLAAVRETLPHAVALGVDIGVENPGELRPEDVERIVGETLGRAFDKVDDNIRSRAAAVYEAFCRVCREEMAVEPETAFAAFLGPLHREALGLEQLDRAQADEEELSAWREMFARKWRERVA